MSVGGTSRPSQEGLGKGNARGLDGNCNIQINYFNTILNVSLVLKGGSHIICACTNFGDGLEYNLTFVKPPGEAW